MAIYIKKEGTSRREFLKTSAATTSMLTFFATNKAIAQDSKVIKIGFLAPLTGATAAWGKPGLDGLSLWQERVNSGDGIVINGEKHTVDIIAYDNEYDPAKARTGATELVLEEQVQFVMMLGGDTWPGAKPVSDRTGVLFSTLLPSDLSPDTENLVAPCEVHPVYNVTGVEWLSKNHPELKTAVMCAQDDALGLPSIATYLAAFEAAGIQMQQDPVIFDPATTDFAPIVTKMIASNPDIVCLDTCYSDYVHPIIEQLFQQGFEGQILSCTADFYDQIIEKTSVEYLEGMIFQFPDFDDPALNSDQINFHDPNKFYADFNERFPGQWGAVSWEYASIMELWARAAEKANSTDPAAVKQAMLEGGKAPHIFGEADWWGEDLFGINHALVGNWPVVRIENGKAVIKDFLNIPAWYDKNGELLKAKMKEYGQLYTQRQ